MATNLVRGLAPRRVPEILGIYLGAPRVAIQSAVMLVHRHFLSGRLVGLGSVLLVSPFALIVLLAKGDQAEHVYFRRRLSSVKDRRCLHPSSWQNYQDGGPS